MGAVQARGGRCSQMLMVVDTPRGGLPVSLARQQEQVSRVVDENLLEKGPRGGCGAGSDPQACCAAGTWCRQERLVMEGWWPSRWVPLCERSVGDQQHREEALCPQLRVPWCVPHAGMGSPGCAEPSRGADTAVVAGDVS